MRSVSTPTGSDSSNGNSDALSKRENCPDPAAQRSAIKAAAGSRMTLPIKMNVITDMNSLKGLLL